MPRLYRPHVPLEVRCRVVLRQLGELWPDDVIKSYSRGGNKYAAGGTVGGLWVLLGDRLYTLAGLLDCAVADLRLDHDPALATRQRKGEGKDTVYTPDANDPEFLIYREKHAHHIKTNVRGDGAQHPDRVLIKRERRRQKKKTHKRTHKKGRLLGKRKIKLRSQWPSGRKIPSRKMRT